MPRWFLERRVAQAWGVPPWVVADAPAGEVEAELRLLDLEAQAATAPTRG